MKPQVGVAAVVFKADQVLLIKRGKPPGMGDWSLPGGRLECGETLEACAIREISEETGLIIEPQAMVDVVELIDQDEHNSIMHHYILIDYWAVVTGGVLQRGDDATEAGWHDLESLDSLGVRGMTVNIIHKAMKMRDLSEAICI